MIYTFVRQAELARLTGAARTAALRLNICSMIQYAGGGHLGSSLSSLKLYEHLMWDWSLVISSKGHDCAAIYAIKHGKFILDDAYLLRFRQPNGLPGHPERAHGWAVSTGSLGMGLSKAVGLALADRTRRVYCVIGDGEMQEGQVWEAACHAARARLDNLIVLIDANGYQSEGPILVPQDREPFGPFKGACWTCCPVGYDDPIPTQFVPGWPTVLLCHTKKGDGVPHWSHSGALDAEQYEANVAHLRKALPVGSTYQYAGPHHDAPVRSEMMRAFRAAMIKHGEHPDVVVLDADLTWDAGLDGLREDRGFPLEPVGIAEQHMVSCAVGLAAAGKQPVCHTFARFFTRATEQIRDALNEPGLAIRFVGTLAGPLNVGPGPSHETDFDLAVFRQGPCRIYEPHTPEEVGQAVEQMFRDPVSSYLRLLARPVRGFER
jgi:transketolase